MKFEWHSELEQQLYVSMSYYGITMNKHIITLLRSPEYVQIGIDREHKLVGIKPVRSSFVQSMLDPSSKSMYFPFKSKISKDKNVRVNSKTFMDKIQGAFEIDLTQTRRFRADYIEKQDMLIIFIEEF